MNPLSFDVEEVIKRTTPKGFSVTERADANKPNYTGVADYLFFKAMEEMGEATQAICKMFQKGAGGKWDDKATNFEHVSMELSNVSTVIAMLIDLELIDLKKFWSEHDKKAEKWMGVVQEMIKKVDKNNNDSNGRETGSE